MLAIYARVSTGQQVVEGTSLDNQVEMCVRKATTELNFSDHNIEIYKEEGFTGEDIDRPEMNRLRADVGKGLISHIMCVHPDRLARDLTDKLIVCAEFERKDIQLVFVDTEYKNTPEGQLFFNMQSAIAQYELALIKKRTVRGRLKSVEKNHRIMPMRVAPFGYDYNDGQLTVNQEEAEYVKLIFHWYVNENFTMRQIGENLFKLGATPKRGESKNWSASSIGKILSNETYIGNYFYNRRKTKKLRGQKTETGATKKTISMRDKEDWIKVEVQPIIDKGLFELAQRQKQKNFTRTGRRSGENEYLLRAIIKCGHCNRAWNSTSYPSSKSKKYPIYRCPNKYPKRYGEGVVACKAPVIRAEVLDEFVWNMVTEYLNNPELVTNQDSEKTKDITSELTKMIELLNKQLEQQEKEKEKIKIMFRKSLISEDEMESDLKSVNHQIESMQREIKKYAQEKDVVERQESMNNNMADIKTGLQELLQTHENFTFEEKRFIVDKIIDEIILTYDEKTDEIKITCLGTLQKLAYAKASSGGEEFSFVYTLSKEYVHKTKENMVVYQSRFRLIPDRKWKGERRLVEDKSKRVVFLS